MLQKLDYRPPRQLLFHPTSSTSLVRACRPSPRTGALTGLKGHPRCAARQWTRRVSDARGCSRSCSTQKPPVVFQSNDEKNMRFGPRVAEQTMLSLYDGTGFQMCSGGRCGASSASVTAKRWTWFFSSRRNSRYPVGGRGTTIEVP